MDHYKSPLGLITLESDGECLTGLCLDSQASARNDEEAQALNGELEAFAKAKEWLDIYFQGKDPGFLPPLKVSGSEFRKTVCDIMLTIPFGQTMTYGQIAKRAAEMLGKEKMSAQAVGGAVGHNPISVIIPCHRVVGANGNLTGYTGGMDKKVELLKIEGALKEEFFVPSK